MVKQFHIIAQYHTTCGPYATHTSKTTSIKQGCKIAPFLWGCFCFGSSKRIRQKGLQRLKIAVTLFAYDTRAYWTLLSLDDLAKALDDIRIILEVLLDLGLTINYSKTAILYKLKGNETHNFLQHHVIHRPALRVRRLLQGRLPPKR